MSEQQEMISVQQEVKSEEQEVMRPTLVLWAWLLTETTILTLRPSLRTLPS